MRKFEVVKKEFLKYDMEPTNMPIRSTKYSAGYDLFSPTDAVIEPGKIVNIWTNIKAMCNEDEFIMICDRSSMGKKGIMLANGVAVIDCDYYGNQSNDGNIGVLLYNSTLENFVVKRGDKIAQALFMKYLPADEDNVLGVERTSGFGSTGK